MNMGGGKKGYKMSPMMKAKYGKMATAKYGKMTKAKTGKLTEKQKDLPIDLQKAIKA